MISDAMTAAGIGVLAASLVVGVWCSRRKPMHTVGRQAVSIETAQRRDQEAMDEKAQAFEQSGERYYFVAVWDKDTKLPTFYGNGKKTLEEARQAAAKFAQNGFGLTEVRDAKDHKAIERIWLEGDRVTSIEM